MNYVVGQDWRDQWDVVITSAGKPAFYTEDNRPFREVDIDTGKLKFKQVSAISFRNTVCGRWFLFTILFVLCISHFVLYLGLSLGPQTKKGACIYSWLFEWAYKVYQLVTAALFVPIPRWYSIWWYLFASDFSRRHVHRRLSLCR